LPRILSSPTSRLEITITESRNPAPILLKPLYHLFYRDYGETILAYPATFRGIGAGHMTAVVGFPTLRLVRHAVGRHTLEGLAPGEWREERIRQDSQD